MFCADQYTHYPAIFRGGFFFSFGFCPREYLVIARAQRSRRRHCDFGAAVVFYLFFLLLKRGKRSAVFLARLCAADHPNFIQNIHHIVIVISRLRDVVRLNAIARFLTRISWRVSNVRKTTKGA